MQICDIDYIYFCWYRSDFLASTETQDALWHIIKSLKAKSKCTQKLKVKNNFQDGIKDKRSPFEHL